MNTLAVIPARGGSQGLLRKNLLPSAGTPMFLRSAQAARDEGCQVVVSTDDAEIRSTAIVAGFQVHDRGPELADSVVDDVVKAAAGKWEGSVLLVQPTVQPITADILGRFMGYANEHGLSPAQMVQWIDHQIWDDDEWLIPRENRQDRRQLGQELGIRWWKHRDQIGEDPQAVHVGTTGVPGLVDIDTAADYRSITAPKQIALWPLAREQYGSGHVRRCLAIP